MRDQQHFPWRQVHLDFHTSEHIAGIGSQFDPDVFAGTLQRAHVNSITCFARCHHGWIYFDTKQFPERRHPYLTRNLLVEQIEACHQRGIRVPIYVSVQWDHYTATHHPEWLAINDDGEILGHTKPFQPGFYRELCINSPYRDFLKATVQEILETMPVDGLFFDIVRPLDDCSIWTIQTMQDLGMDPADPAQRQAYAANMVNEFKLEMSGFVGQFSDDCTIFYNDGNVGPQVRSVEAAYSHFEIESLPSGDWGYDHFPIAARYTRTLGKPMIGMTGKFHTSWGDFHSYKNEAALEFECFHSLALGGGCSIGDQLHPNGQLDAPTYDLIGRVYEKVATREAWCLGAAPICEVGVLTPAEFADATKRNHPALSGALHILQEAAIQFDIIDSSADFSHYKLLILPDVVPVTAELNQKLQSCLDNGRALIASYRAGLNEVGDAFALSAPGLHLVGEAPFNPDFILAEGEIGAGLPSAEHVMYLRGLEVSPRDGTTVLAQTIAPYFNRTWEHFSSHRHAPSSGKVAYPAITQNGRAIYFAHPIFSQYQANAPRWCKQLVGNAIHRLIGDPLVRHNGPSSLIVTLNEQAGHNRRVLHALHYLPIRRSKEMDIIEDVIPLHNVKFVIQMDHLANQVKMVPQKIDVPFAQEGDQLTFTLPVILGHQMVVIE